MRAGKNIIRRIVNGIEQGNHNVFDKFALKYASDVELIEIYNLVGEVDDKKLTAKLKDLYNLRKFESGGSVLFFKDRRRTNTSKRGFENF